MENGLKELQQRFAGFPRRAASGRCRSGVFLWGKPLGMGSGAKESCGEEEKGGPAGVQAAICLAWLLYASFGVDVM